MEDIPASYVCLPEGRDPPTQRDPLFILCQVGFDQMCQIGRTFDLVFIHEVGEMGHGNVCFFCNVDLYNV